MNDTDSEQPDEISPEVDSEGNVPQILPTINNLLVSNRLDQIPLMTLTVFRIFLCSTIFVLTSSFVNKLCHSLVWQTKLATLPDLKMVRFPPCKSQIVHSDVHHLTSVINFLIQSASPILTHLLRFYPISHVLLHLLRYYHCRRPSLLCSSTLGRKLV